MATGATQTPRAGNERSDPRQSEGLYDQASEAVSGMAESASDMWDEAYERGARYYRDADGNALITAIVAGAIGYGLAYLIHGYQARWEPDPSVGLRNYGRVQNRRDYP